MACHDQPLPPHLHLCQPSHTPTLVYQGQSVAEVLSNLHGKGIQSLLVEGGATLLGAFLEAGCWDELRVEVAPFMLGTGIPSPAWPSHGMYATADYGGNRVLVFRKNCSKDGSSKPIIPNFT